MPLPTKYFDAGSYVFREGEAPGPVYLIKSGCVELIKRRGRKEVVLERLGKDCVFGEMSLIDNSPRSASAFVWEEAECFVLDRRGFEERLKKLDPFMRAIFRILVTRLRETTEQSLSLRKEIDALKPPSA